MTENRTLFKAITTKLEAHKSLEPVDIQTLLISAQNMVSDPDCDYRTKSNMIKFLVEHDWHVYEHENPVTQKVETTLIAPPQVLQVEFIKGKDAIS
jgi:hypothetical protein